MTPEILIELREVKRHFAGPSSAFGKTRRTIKAVDGVSLQLRAGETLALVGESGCGKSTIGRLLVNVDRPTAGSISYRGQDMARLGRSQARTLRRRVQMVFQDPFSSLNPRMTVAQTLAEPLLLHGLADRQSVAAKVRELLLSVGLSPSRAGSFPHQFSGGQRQRIGIARALAVQPDIIVCDEPVSALDVSIRAQIINLLQDLQRERGIALLFISHDLGVVRHIADRVAVMYLGRIVELADKKTMFEAPRHPYTRALLSAIPIPDPAARADRAALEGELPSPMAVPSGCRFHPRCPFAIDACRQIDPALEADEEGRSVACIRADKVETLDKRGGVPVHRLSSAFSRRLALYRNALRERAP